MNIFILLVLILVAYLIGGLPTGYMVARWRGVADIREYGSGNIGATNVGRILGSFYFLIVFFIDAGKAALMLYIAYSCGVMYVLHILAVIWALLLGNCFTPFLRFRGGKGVATSVGIMLYLLQPWFMAIIIAMWIMVWCITQTVGIASALTSLIIPLLTWFLVPDDGMLFCIIASLSCMVFVRHISNIQRYFISIF